MELKAMRNMQFLTGHPSAGVPRRSPQLDMIVSDDRHIKGRGEQSASNSTATVGPAAAGLGLNQTSSSKAAIPGGFASVLAEALRDAEKLDNQSQDLTARSVFDPDSVEAHTVMIAAEKSKFALNLTKTLADGFVRTFRDLSNPR